MIEMVENDAHYLRGSRPRSNGGAAIRVVDLFSGVGGLVLGIEEAARRMGYRIDVRLAAEVDATAAATYVRNLRVPAARISGDVTRLFDRRVGSSLSFEERGTRKSVGPNLDLLVGGPPCQGHSTLNNHTRGDDPKNELYLVMLRAAEILEPRALLIENVPAVERDRGRCLQVAIDRLAQLGYHVDSQVASVADVGVAQLRRRHVLVAHADCEPRVGAAIDSSRVEEARTLRWAIGDLREGETIFDSAAALTLENRRRAEYLLRHDLYDLPNRLRPSCQQGPHKYKSMYGRLRWNEPAQTITSGFGSPGQGRYLHPKYLRTLTPHEAARLQFFPDWFDFSLYAHRKHLARAIGNAVPPKLAFAMGTHLLSLGRARNDVRHAAGDSHGRAKFGR